MAPSELTPAPVVLVTGGEDLLAERAVLTVTAAVRGLDPDVTVERIEAPTYEAGRLEQLSSPSLFGGGSLIVASGIESANDAFVVDATAYLKAPAAGAWLVLRHAGGNRAKPLLDAARKAGAPEAACLPITKDEEKVEFAAAEFRRLGRRARRRRSGRWSMPSAATCASWRLRAISCPWTRPVTATRAGSRSTWSSSGSAAGSR